MDPIQPHESMLADDGTAIIGPPALRKAANGSPQRRYLTRLMRMRVRIEPVIDHLKSDYRLYRNFLWGTPATR